MDPTTVLATRLQAVEQRLALLESQRVTPALALSAPAHVANSAPVQTPIPSYTFDAFGPMGRLFSQGRLVKSGKCGYNEYIQYEDEFMPCGNYWHVEVLGINYLLVHVERFPQSSLSFGDFTVPAYTSAKIWVPVNSSHATWHPTLRRLEVKGVGAFVVAFTQ